MGLDPRLVAWGKVDEDMKINPDAEDLGRHAVRWAVAQERDNFLAAVGRIADAPEPVRDQVVPIYAAVGVAALLAIYEGKPPSPSQNETMARDLIASEPWAPVELNEVYEVLASYSTDGRAPQIASEKVAVAVLVTDAYLLTWYARNLGHQDFYGFLDDILNGLATDS